MTPNFEYYKVFYYVVKYQNFTQAANVLITSQPSVTRCIKNLENNLGCRLFVRSKRGVSLTPEGELLYRYIAPACESIFKGEEALSGALSLQYGSVYIGATETAIHCFLLKKLESFHNKYPYVSIKITNASTPPLLNDLKSGKIDLAVVTTPVAEESLTITKTQSFRDLLVAGPSFAHLKDKKLKLAELQKYPFVCLSRSTMTYQFYSDLFAKHGQQLKPDIELASADLLLPMIKRNLGIGFVPEMMASEALKNGDIIRLRLKEEIRERYICVMYDMHRPLSIAAHQMIETLRVSDP